MPLLICDKNTEIELRPLFCMYTWKYEWEIAASEFWSSIYQIQCNLWTKTWKVVSEMSNSGNGVIVWVHSSWRKSAIGKYNQQRDHPKKSFLLNQK